MLQKAKGALQIGYLSVFNRKITLVATGQVKPVGSHHKFYEPSLPQPKISIKIF